MTELTETFEILGIRGGERLSKNDVVIKESSLTIFVNDKELVTLLCSPDRQKALAVGFLFSEGFLQSREEIESLILNQSKGIVWVRLAKDFQIDENFIKGRTVTSGCARGIMFNRQRDFLPNPAMRSDLRIDAEAISRLMTSLQVASSLFESTGGIHSCALGQGEEIILFREDIGRHNAVDKIIGECLLNQITTADKIVLTSGRMSSEIVLKVARAGMPILVSRTAPTSAAIKLADEFGLTMVGFARGKRMNVYTHDWRIN
ncbi:MAG: formate dehydrogenase family accessory protein FdhD [Ignavibacteriales bacterium CG07_land_8_20_14_0_80_59_12]|nr:MAG: formate dehydrogenase family accessory protein FdhD [Ignavibacteriales bacterium CG07_land_8_20_14_0_80_59_12]